MRGDVCLGLPALGLSGDNGDVLQITVGDNTQHTGHERGSECLTTDFGLYLFLSLFQDDVHFSLLLK